MFKKFFSKALVVLAIMITLTTLFSMSALAVEENTVMTVYTKDLDEEIYKEFDNFEDGWVFLIEKYTTYFDVFDVKLYADWVAPDGYFYYTNEDGDEVGTDKGRLAVGISWYDEGGAYDHNQINIDLNGHKIDRNLKNPTKNGSVFLIESGSVRIFDSSEAQTGMITGGNNTGNGGAFLVDNGAFNIEKSAILLDGGTITGNYAANGAGIYWNSDGLLIITDGAITGNHATEKGGGVYFDDWGGIYIGGTPVIKDNYIKGTSKQSNLYLADTDVVLKLTRDQDEAFNIQHIPDIPLSEGAEIGISTIGDDEKLTDENSLFREEDFTYFFPDDTTHFVRSVHSEKEGVTSYDLYYTSWQHENKRAPRVTNVLLKDNSLVKDKDFNYDKQTLTLTVANNKRDYFDMMSLDRLVSLEFNDQRYYLARMGNPLNLHEGQQYRIMADNGTYVLLVVNIVPEGGKWADVQDPYVPEYAAIVFNEHYTAGYTDIGKAWADALKQSLTHPTTFKLLADWIAKDGKFYAEDADGDEYGTDDGYLDIDDENINLTIDLNGHTIDRNLDKPASNGYIMYIGEGRVTITDTSEEGTGKITGGNNTGDGGAIFMDNGPFGLPTEGGILIIEGGNITGNHSDYRGGAIYSEAPFTSITVYDVKITDNTAKYGGAVALTSTSDAHFYSGDISGNSATKYGGAFYCYDGGDVVVDGSTVVSNNTAPYGGCAYIGIQGELRFYSGYIKDNTADYGGGIYTYESFVMGGSEAYLINNVAKYDGGGVCALGEYGEVRINYGNITGNKAVNGAGIYWNAYNEIFGGVLNNVIITGNEASGIGGGVYVADDRYVYVGGRTVIRDNTSCLGNDNINLIGYDSCITHGAIDYFGTSLSEGSEIGIRAEKIKNERIIVSDEGGFEEDSINYFTADDPTTRLTSVEDTDYNGYRISLVDKYDGEMLVEVEGGDTKSFEDFSKGWVYALQQSLDKPTTVTLGADWIARDGVFYCVDEDGDEYGTKNGYLYINDNHIITIDLNGHKIDRNLKEPTDDGVVFWLYDYDAKLTIKDSFGGGIITGANNDGNGGAFFVERGSLYIEGGEIRDNKAENGAGIYWESKNNLCVYGGVIVANEAQEFGGGIYGTDYGNMYFGGNAIVSGNIDKYSENNNLYLDDNDVYVNRTAGQSEDIPDVPFRAGASIGISAYDTQSLISGSDSCFGWEDFDYFFSDRDMYFLRKDYEADDGNNAYKLYIDSIANKPQTAPVMSVTVKDGATQSFVTFDEGWSYALKQSLTKPTTITLLADWTAENSEFDYAKGTKDGYFYLDDNYVITIDLNGHKIDRNLSEPIEEGFVFYIYDYDAKITIKDSAGGGKITGANNDGNGGAFFVERGSLYIESGEIRGNKATNGAGIYWESQNSLCIYGGVIVANEVQQFGGGIYGTDWGDMYFGGNAVVSGNTDKNSENNNLYLDDDDVYVNLTAGQSEDIPDIPFIKGASIGISAYNPQSLISGSDSCFGWDDLDYFFSDRDKYFIRRAYDAGGENNEYKLYIDYIENIPEPAPEIMSVAVEGGITQGFGDFGKGWAYAVKQSVSKPTTITLLADWVAENGMFVCIDEYGNEYGSEDGYLYLNDNHNLVIDLNGHKIDRNLKEPTEDGVVFRIYDYDAKLTVKDSVGGGKITGANNTGNGGAFFVERGSLYIESGEIIGNKAENGAGIYWESRNDLYVYGGKITDNTANTNGGGIYLTDWGNAYFGGSIVVDGNIGGTKKDNVYLSDEDTFLNYAGGQNGSYPFTEDAKIGLACYDIVHYKPLNDADSGFDADSIQHFVMDDDTYFIDSVYDFESGVYNFSVAYNQDGRMYVTTYNSKKTFNDLGKGWVYALQMSMETPTTITLESDWIHYSDIGFYYLDEDGSEYGTDNGRLYLNDSDINLTIDLNGHSIIRNVTSPVEDGQVFYMGAGSLTITDTSEGKNGIITGGNSIGNGGGFYVDGGTLHLKGGSIAENNTLKYGGGIYIDGAELFLEGGSVSDNKAGKQGGGIYVNDATLTIEDGEISRNYACSSGGGVCCYQYSTVYMKGGTVADNTSEAGGGGFSIGVDNLLMHMSGGSIVRNLALEGGGGISWYCDGNLVLTGGVITENHDGYGNTNIQHLNRGGGVYAYHYDGDTEIGTDPYIGGDIQIYNNFSSISSESIHPSWSGVSVVESNLYLAENAAKVKQALGQDDEIPNAPLTDGANVGISREYKDVITNDDSMFDEASLKYLHSDTDNYYINAVLDDDYYQLSLVKQTGIIAYNKNSKEIVADIKEAGEYIVVFADYENNRLVNVDMVEFEFKEGINIVPQEITSFALTSGDKVILWYNTTNIVPVCDALTVK